MKTRAVLAVTALLTTVCVVWTSAGRAAEAAGKTGQTRFISGVAPRPLPPRAAARLTPADENLVQDAIAVFLEHASDPPVTDLVVLAGWISDLVPHEGLRRYVEQGYSALQAAPDHLSPNFLRWVPGKEQTTPLKEPLCEEEEKMSRTDCLILTSLWCDVAAPVEDFLKDMQAAVSRARGRFSGDSAKVLLLALTELRRNNCLDSHHVDALFHQAEGLGRDLAEASPDGYGPGVAVLLRAGSAKFVKEEWIDRIRDSLRTKMSSPITCGTCLQEAKPFLYEIYAVVQWNAVGGGSP